MAIKIQGDKEHYENTDAVSWEQIRQYLIWNLVGDGGRVGQKQFWKESDIRAGLAYLVMGVTVVIKAETRHNLRCQCLLKDETGHTLH